MTSLQNRPKGCNSPKAPGRLDLKWGSRFLALVVYLVAGLLVFGLFLSSDPQSLQASPFQSPHAENTIHQPLITQYGIGNPDQPTGVEFEGIPLIGIIGLLLLLFVPATAYMAIRRR